MNTKALKENLPFYFNRFFQEVELRTGIRCSKPSEVFIKLTERCNCRCQMCAMWKNNSSSEGELTTEDWKRLLLGLRHWLGKRHIWFTGGEPFLRQDCIELIRYGSSLGLSISVITNGVLLNPDRIPSLIEAGLKEYHVSIDSMQPEIHNHLRGVSGVHKRAVENVLFLKNCATKRGVELKIVIKTIIMGYNVTEILPLVEWAETNGFHSVLQPLESIHEGEDDPHWFNKSPYWPKEKQLNELIEIIDQLIEKEKHGLRVGNTGLDLKAARQYFLDPVTHYGEAKDHNPSGKTGGRHCGNGIGWMEILSRGGLRMCRHMPPQGDIRNTTAREFWKNRIGCWKNPAQLCFKHTKRS